MVIGMVAGSISTAGFCSPLIDSATDTCGINNLHGMPGIFGGLMSAVVPLIISDKTPEVSPGPQLIGLAGTLAISGVTGFITGKIMAAVGPEVDEPYSDE